jgi:hypothetical protein
MESRKSSNFTLRTKMSCKFNIFLYSNPWTNSSIHQQYKFYYSFPGPGHTRFLHAC